MASIDCPGCGSQISHFSIDVVAGGGQVAGSGGIVCPQCSRRIPNAEIVALVRGGGVGGSRPLDLSPADEPLTGRIIEWILDKLEAIEDWWRDRRGRSK